MEDKLCFLQAIPCSQDSLTVAERNNRSRRSYRSYLLTCVFDVFGDGLCGQTVTRMRFDIDQREEVYPGNEHCVRLVAEPATRACPMS